MPEFVLPWSHTFVRLRPPARRLLSVLAVPREVVAWEERAGVAVEGRLRLEAFYADPAGRLARVERELAVLGSWLPPRGEGEEEAPPEGLPPQGEGREEEVGASSWWAEGRVESLAARLDGRGGRSLTVGGELRLRLSPPPPPDDAVEGAVRRLRLEEIAGEGEAEVLETVQADLDHRARQVIAVHGSVETSSGQVVAGGVLARGDLLLRVYCVGEDGVIRYHQLPARIETLVRLPAEEAGRARVALSLVPPEAELLGEGGRVRVRAAARIRVQVLRPAEVLVPAGPSPEDGRRETVRVQEVAGSVGGRGVFRAEHRLPVVAGRLGPATGRVVEAGLTVRGGQVVLDGFWQWEVLYADEAGEERFAGGEEPFSLCLSGAPPEEGLLAVAESITVRVEASLGEDGSLLRLTASVTAEVNLYRDTVVDLAVGRVAGEEGVATRTVDVERLVGQGATRSLLEKRGTLVTRALAITAVAGRVEELAWEVIPEQVLVRGVLRQQILYVDRNRVHRYQTESFPVSLLLDVPGAAPGQEASVAVGVCHVSHALLPDVRTFHQQVVLDASCRVTERRRLTVATGRGLPRAVTFRLQGSLPVPRRWRGSRVRGRAAVTEVAVEGGGERVSLRGRLRLDLVAVDAAAARTECVPFAVEVRLGPRWGSGLRVAVRAVTGRVTPGPEARVDWEAVAVAWWSS